MKQQRVKWHTNRDKPTTLNPSRRRTDSRVMNSFDSIFDEKAGREVRYFGYMDKIVSVNKRRNFVVKNSNHLKRAKLFEEFIRRSKPKTFEIVNLKIAKDFNSMQYVQRPSLGALKAYLEGWKNVDGVEKIYCDRFLSLFDKQKINRRSLQMDLIATETELKKIFEMCKKESDTPLYGILFSATNFIVCGVNKQGLLKIAIVDV
jgi:hypothetical protein